jgi:hypothetical protein
MIGSAIIEVGIGLVLVFSLLSIIVTQVNNVIVNVLNLRAENLRDGIERLITDADMQREILTHPLVDVVQGPQAQNARVGWPQRLGAALRQGVALIFQPHLINRRDTTATSYVDANVFSSVMISSLAKNPELVAQAAQLENLPVSKFIEMLKANIDDPRLERTLEAMLSTATNITEVQNKLALWFNSNMSQMSDVYKRRVQYVSFMVGLLLAILLNVDSIYMAQTFWNDPALREVAVSAAQAELRTEQQVQRQDSVRGTDDLNESITRVRNSVDYLFELRLPIGWTFNSFSVVAVPTTTTGGASGAGSAQTAPTNSADGLSGAQPAPIAVPTNDMAVDAAIDIVGDEAAASSEVVQSVDGSTLVVNEQGTVEAAVDETGRPLVYYNDPRQDQRNILKLLPAYSYSPGEWIAYLLTKIVGWVITAFACMQGSDFWFNLLRQLTSQRQAPANT